jgi:hypothetical protein
MTDIAAGCPAADSAPDPLFLTHPSTPGYFVRQANKVAYLHVAL